MGNPIRKSDAPLLASIIPLSWAIPSHYISNNQHYQNLIESMPNWLFWSSLGFSIAAWLLNPWQKQSRVSDAWHWLTDSFTVEGLHVQEMWHDLETVSPNDVAVRLRIRFTKNIRGARLRLRLFAATGMGREPFLHVIPLKTMDVVQGQVLDIPLVDMGIPKVGWDNMRKRGWGFDKSINLIGGTGNVAVLECEGRLLTQRHRFFVAMQAHTGQDKPPTLYAQDEDENVFDTSSFSKVGYMRYAG